ncbi:MAG TPA: hypothetical protein VGR08_10545 [Thermomicrobiales bacterium]|nr:hypothetical protein [Thermomicrobiales bacterium]
MGETMKYEVRYQIGGDERTVEVEADSAAAAAKLAQEEHLGSDEVFELIQVRLLDDHVASEMASESSR